MYKYESQTNDGTLRSRAVGHCDKIKMKYEKITIQKIEKYFEF